MSLICLEELTKPISKQNIVVLTHIEGVFDVPLFFKHSIFRLEQILMSNVSIRFYRYPYSNVANVSKQATNSKNSHEPTHNKKEIGKIDTPLREEVFHDWFLSEYYLFFSFFNPFDNELETEYVYLIIYMFYWNTFIRYTSSFIKQKICVAHENDTKSILTAAEYVCRWYNLVSLKSLENSCGTY